jgi:hypothetical protein
MKNIDTKRLFKGKATGHVYISAAAIVLVYFLISIYFANHFFFHTVINGVDVSLKAHDDAADIIRSYIKDYKLQLIERNGVVEEIIGQDIGMQHNEKNGVYKIRKMQRPFLWLSALVKHQKYYVHDLFIYDKDALENKINELNCLNKDIIEPRNVSFKYSNGSCEAVEEIYGNKVNKEKLCEAIEVNILKGKTKLDLNESFCYENPKYTLSSDKTFKTKSLLNKYVSTKITYIFESEKEILDGNKINRWLSVDENLDVVINKEAVKQYVRELSKKYDTVGVARKFKTSTNKIIKVNGGLYGWKIDRIGEVQALLKNIKLGEVLEKEPIYAQKAIYRNKDDIGDTYVEINITKQYLWFYKDGKLLVKGAVVTGNPNRGNSTNVGVYMLNYKEKGSILSGQDYETKVNYWMPFYGNIGIHDASWRHSFGREIYKRNGSHGCVNAPLYLARIIFNNIEEGTPIICYEE